LGVSVPPEMPAVPPFMATVNEGPSRRKLWLQLGSVHLLPPLIFSLLPSPSCVCASERLWKLYLNHWIRQATRLDALARLPACPPGAAAQHFDQHRRHYSLLFAAFFNQNNYRGNGIATATASVTANVQATGGSGTSSSDVPLATSEPVDPAAYLVPALAAGAEAGAGAGETRSSGVLGRLRR